MYKLHYYPSNANAAPHMLLEEIGAPFELSLVDKSKNAQKSDEYTKLNPNGRIPTLEDGSLVIFEAAAIVLHLVDRHPDAAMAPLVGTHGRAKFYQWLTFLTNSLQEELMVWQHPDRLVGFDESACAAVSAGAAARASKYFDIIEDHLRENGPFFVDKELSAVDLYFTMLARWGRSLSKSPRSRHHIAALLDRTTNLPSVQRAYRSEGINEDIC